MSVFKLLTGLSSATVFGFSILPGSEINIYKQQRTHLIKRITTRKKQTIHIPRSLQLKHKKYNYTGNIISNVTKVAKWRRFCLVDSNFPENFIQLGNTPFILLASNVAYRIIAILLMCRSPLEQQHWSCRNVIKTKNMKLSISYPKKT